MQDTELALLVDRFMRKIHSGLQERAPGFDREKVGPGGGIVLMTLADTGRISLNELTKCVARDKSQMTRMVRSLEAKGLVQREVAPDDGRVSVIYLTPKGSEIVGELMQTVAEVIGDILEPISESERKTLQSLLAQIA